MQKALWRHYQVGVVGVTVFKRSDGTYCQDYATVENSDTNVNYPIIQDGGPYATVWDIHQGVTFYNQNPYITTIYYGGHTWTVSAAEAAALNAAGYTTH